MFHAFRQANETKPCACCAREIDCGPFGDDRDGFDAEILLTEGAMVCLACADEWIEESLQPRADWERPYEGGLAAWL